MLRFPYKDRRGIVVRSWVAKGKGSDLTAEVRVAGRSCRPRVVQATDLRWSEDVGKPFAHSGTCFAAEVAGVDVPVLVRKIVVADQLGGTAGNQAPMIGCECGS